ncbi:NERD domain-containing protein [Rossellomorea aquimaris]|uniref:nuclease-related domain-containing protein n=1 Tax=Rossellomorea aquimaris TaxID=189382 RepID=UPI001CD7E4E8|nr:nuclease-related domain-containing protein [Rossellomorea aquimaris]MCA1059340.1 NERD domain-containing protein [Rossellomorea aquimaris]
MILKERTIPLKIPYLEAMMRRNLQGSIKTTKMDEQLLKLWAGYHGECKLDRHISTIDNEELLILNDLCIPIGTTFFQIDSLILSRYLALILEVKNFSGIIDIGGEFEQMSRVIDGEKIGYSNPIEQAKRCKVHLNQWMKTRKLPMLPIDYLVVFTNTSSVLNSLGQNHKHKGKILKIERFVSEYLSLIKNYTIPHLTKKELKKISHFLIKSHTEFRPGPIEEEVINGVQCNSCLSFCMIRNKGSWFCPSCKTYDRHAHIQAIHDLLLLKGPSIGNRQAREFLGIESPKIIHHLLNSMELNVHGKGKGRTYSIPFPQLLQKPIGSIKPTQRF